MLLLHECGIGQARMLQRKSRCRSSRLGWPEEQRNTDCCKCSDLGVPAPHGRNIVPMRVYHSRGSLIGKGQKRVARAKPLPGGCGGVPHNKVPPSPGQEKGARGMRSSGPWIDPDRLEKRPLAAD